MKQIINDRNLYLKLEKAKNLIKLYSEPIVLNVLAWLYETNSDDDILTVITGGAALSAWLKTDVTLTGDFDIRIVSKKQMYNGHYKAKFVFMELDNGINQKINQKSDELIDILVLRLNDYFFGERFLVQIQYELELLGFNIGLKNNEIFKKRQIQSSNLIGISYTLYNSELDKEINLIDLYPINNNSMISDIEYNNLYKGNIFTTSSEFPIPYFIHNEVPHATLGYTLWDLDRMIEYEKHQFQTQQIYSKLARYEYKKLLIQKMLSGTPLELNCQALKSTIETCSSEFNDDICTLDGLEYNIDELIEYGINNNIFPDDQEELLLLSDTMGINYLCDYIKRLSNKN